MSRRRVVMLNAADTTRDPRVRRTAGALVDHGHDVVVVGPRLPPHANRAQRFGIEEVRGDRVALQVLTSRFARRFPEAAAWIGAVEPRVLEAPGRSVPRFARQVKEALVRRVAPKLGRTAPPYWLPVDDEGVIADLRRVVVFNGGLAERALALRPDAIYANDLDTLLAGVIVKRRSGIPLVFDAHEIYAEMWATSARAEMWHHFYEGLEKRLLADTDARLTVCDSIGRYMQEAYGAGPVTTIPNVPSVRFLVPEERLTRKRAERVVLYHGLFQPNRGLEEVVRAFRFVRGATLVLRGYGLQDRVLREIVEREGLGDRVTFAAPVGVDELVEKASDADIGVNPFIPVSMNTELALPNKFFEYLMAGLATASSDLTELRSFTQKLDVGILFPGTSPEQMADGLNGLLADPGRLDACRRRAWTAARTELNWENIRGRFLDVVDAAIR